jgi:hypothetical protein
MLGLNLTKKLFLLNLTKSVREAVPHRRLAQNPLALLPSKVWLCEVFIFHLYKAVILIFINAAVVVELGLASAYVCAKDTEREDVHADEQLTVDATGSMRDLLVEVETTFAPKITMCDVVLVSRHTGAIDCDAVCGLLTEFL